MAYIEKTKTVTTRRRYVKAVGHRFSFAVNGQCAPQGAIIELGVYEADELIKRKLAVAATEAEVEAAGVDVIVADSSGDKWRDAE